MNRLQLSATAKFSAHCGACLRMLTGEGGGAKSDDRKKRWSPTINYFYEVSREQLVTREFILNKVNIETRY
jgi:hypothetical protein